MDSSKDARRWPEATPQNPCPICGKDHRCKIADGAARCFRSAKPPVGWQVKRRHADGGATFIRDTGDAPRSRQRPRSSAAKAPNADANVSPSVVIAGPMIADAPTPATSATPATLDRAYTALLNRLPLSDKHREQLWGRGLTDNEIDRRRYRTKPAGNCAKICGEICAELGEAIYRATPGFINCGKHQLATYAGLVVPVRDVAHGIIALQLRLDVPTASGKYRYFTSRSKVTPEAPSPGAPIHVSLGTDAAAVVAAGGVIRITEGSLKADVATSLSRRPTFSVPGVGLWRSAIDVLRTLRARTALVAFDVDASVNPDVARHLLACVNGLVEEGFAVELERWNAVDGKGIDDLLAAGKKPEVLCGAEAVTAAKEIAKSAGVDPDKPATAVLGRLTDVLTNGAAALFGNDSLLRSIAELSVHDPPAFAAAKSAVRAARISIRDFDHAMKRHVVAAIKAYPPELARDENGGFFVHAGCICRTRFSQQGPKTVQLCNYTAGIVDETIRNDGAEQTVMLGIAGKLDDGRPLPRIEVSAEAFGKMEWTVPSWGSDAINWAGEQRALPSAIQALSKEKKRQTVFTHTGWAKINGTYAYLHAGGAIAAEKLQSVTAVELGPPLDKFTLPDPPAGAALIDAIRASLKLVDLADDELMLPLLAATYRSIFGPADFSLFLVGRTGAGKSELAALCQQHFGPELDARRLPGSWSSTGNSLEYVAFLAKDALLVVDDYVVSGSSSDAHRLHREADRILRAQGNNSGRQRMRANGSLRPAKSPRGLILCTGEDVPPGHSLRARILVLEVSGTAGIPPKLTPYQADAATGKYAAAMAGFLRWLAPNYADYDATRKTWKTKIGELRTEASSKGQHARSPGIVAELILGFRLFLKFATEIGAITEARRRELRERSWAAILAAANSQGEHQRDSDPALSFVRLIGAVLSSGRGHLANTDGREPDESPESWGWRYLPDARTLSGVFRPEGKRIGWIEWIGKGKETEVVHVYLDPEAALAEAQRLANEQGESSLSISAQTLRKRLNERGLLVSIDRTRQTLTVRCMIEGRRREVLDFRADVFALPEEAASGDKAGKPDQEASNGQVPSQVGQNHQPDPTNANPTAATGNGELVRLVRSDSGGEQPVAQKEFHDEEVDF